MRRVSPVCRRPVWEAQLIQKADQGTRYPGRGEEDAGQALNSIEAARVADMQGLASRPAKGGLQADLGASLFAPEAVSVGRLPIIMHSYHLIQPYLNLLGSLTRHHSACQDMHQCGESVQQVVVVGAVAEVVHVHLAVAVWTRLSGVFRSLQGLRFAPRQKRRPKVLLLFKNHLLNNHKGNCSLKCGTSSIFFSARSGRYFRMSFLDICFMSHRIDIITWLTGRGCPVWEQTWGAGSDLHSGWNTDCGRALQSMLLGDFGEGGQEVYHCQTTQARAWVWSSSYQNLYLQYISFLRSYRTNDCGVAYIQYFLEIISVSKQRKSN